MSIELVHIWVFKIRCPYLNDTLELSVLSQYLPILVWCRKMTMPVWDPIPVWLQMYAYSDISHMGTNIYKFALSHSTMDVKN